MLLGQRHLTVKRQWTRRGSTIVDWNACPLNRLRKRATVEYLQRLQFPFVGELQTGGRCWHGRLELRYGGRARKIRQNYMDFRDESSAKHTLILPRKSDCSELHSTALPRVAIRNPTLLYCSAIARLMYALGDHRIERGGGLCLC